jgi:hypothetical protein
MEKAWAYPVVTNGRLYIGDTAVVGVTMLPDQVAVLRTDT